MYKIVCIAYVELSTFFNYIYTLIVQNCLHFFLFKKKKKRRTIECNQL